MATEKQIRDTLFRDPALTYAEAVILVDHPGVADHSYPPTENALASYFIDNGLEVYTAFEKAETVFKAAKGAEFLANHPQEKRPWKKR